MPCSRANIPSTALRAIRTNSTTGTLNSTARDDGAAATIAPPASESTTAASVT